MSNYEEQFNKYADDLGVEEQRPKNVMFLGIKHNGICEEGKPNTPGFVKTDIELNDGTIVTKWLKHHGAITGYVDKIDYYNRKHNGIKYEGFKLTMNLGAKRAIVDISLNSNPGSKFLNTARNIDFERPLRIEAWRDNQGMQFVLKQKDEETGQYAALKFFYKKDNMHDCPPPEWKPARGNTSDIPGDGEGDWLWDATVDYQIDEILNKIAPIVATFEEERRPFMERYAAQAQAELAQEEQAQFVREADDHVDRSELAPPVVSSGPSSNVPEEPENFWPQRGNDERETDTPFGESTPASRAATKHREESKIREETIRREREDAISGKKPVVVTRRAAEPEPEPKDDDDDIPF